MSSWKKIYTEKDIENTPTDNSAKLVSTSGLNSTLNSKSPNNHQHSSSKITDLINVIYPIGSIYLSTEDVNPNTLFPNTSWEKIEDRFLFGSSNVTGYTNGSTGGSKDVSIVTHTHTQNSHNHTANSHGHSFGDWYAPTISSSQNWGYFGPKIVNTTSGTTYFWVRSSANGGGIGETNVTANQTVTTNSTTATNQQTGVSGTDKNMPPYLVVNIWERKT